MHYGIVYTFYVDGHNTSRKLVAIVIVEIIQGYIGIIYLIILYYVIIHYCAKIRVG